VVGEWRVRLRVGGSIYPRGSSGTPAASPISPLGVMTHDRVHDISPAYRLSINIPYFPFHHASSLHHVHSLRNHPVSRKPSQLGQQSVIAAPTSTVHTQHRNREIPEGGHDTQRSIWCLPSSLLPEERHFCYTTGRPN